MALEVAWHTCTSGQWITVVIITMTMHTAIYPPKVTTNLFVGYENHTQHRKSYIAVLESPDWQLLWKRVTPHNFSQAWLPQAHQAICSWLQIINIHNTCIWCILYFPKPDVSYLYRVTSFIKKVMVITRRAMRFIGIGFPLDQCLRKQHHSWVIFLQRIWHSR